MITDNLCTCGHPDHFHHNTGECAGLPNGDVRINKGFTGCTCRKFEPVGAVCTCGHTKDHHLEYFGDGLFRCEICSCTEFEPAAAGKVKDCDTCGRDYVHCEIAHSTDADCPGWQPIMAKREVCTHLRGCECRAVKELLQRVKALESKGDSK